MAEGIFNKLTNFLMPQEESPYQSPSQPVMPVERKVPTPLRLHTHAELKVFVASPREYSQILKCANRLKANEAVILNLETVATELQYTIIDFMNGVSYITGGHVQRISEHMLLYAPKRVEISTDLHTYSAPNFFKHKI